MILLLCSATSRLVSNLDFPPLLLNHKKLIKKSPQMSSKDSDTVNLAVIEVQWYNWNRDFLQILKQVLPKEETGSTAVLMEILCTFTYVYFLNLYIHVCL